MWYVFGEVTCKEGRGGSLGKRDHLEDLVVDGRTILKWTFKKLDGGTCTGFIRLWIETSGELL